MNKTQLKDLAVALDHMAKAHDILDPIATELREKFDNMSERAQEGEKGEALNEEANVLEGVRDNLSSDISELERL